RATGAPRPGAPARRRGVSSESAANPFRLPRGYPGSRFAGLAPARSVHYFTLLYPVTIEQSSENDLSAGLWSRAWQRGAKRVYTDPDAAWTPEDPRRESEKEGITWRPTRW